MAALAWWHPALGVRVLCGTGGFVLIKFRCGHCSCKLGVPDEYAGRRVRCTECNEACQVPESGVLEDSAVALELDPEPVGDLGGDLRLQDEEVAPAMHSNIDMGLSPSGEDELRAELIARARRPRGRAMKAAGQSADEADEGLGAGNLAVAMGCSAAAALGTTALWVIVFGNLQVGYLVALEFFVPLAAAIGLGTVLRRNGVLIGLLAVAIGMLSVFGGKYVLAKRYFAPRIMLELGWGTNDRLMGIFAVAGLADNDTIVNMVVAATLGYQGVVDPNCADVIGMAYAAGIKYEIPVPEFDADVNKELEKIEANVAQLSEKRRFKIVRGSWYGVYRNYLRMFLETEEGRGFLFKDALKMAFNAYDVILLPFAGILAFRMCWKEGVDFG